MLPMVLVSKHVQYRYSSGIEQNMTFLLRRQKTKHGREQVSTVKEERKDYTDKADAIREHDCIWCMACVSVVRHRNVKVDQSSLEFHEKASGTFNGSVKVVLHHHTHTR